MERGPVFDNRVNQSYIIWLKWNIGNGNCVFSSSYGYGKRDYTHTTGEGAFFLRVIGVVAAWKKFFNHVCPIVDITPVSQD